MRLKMMKMHKMTMGAYTMSIVQVEISILCLTWVLEVILRRLEINLDQDLTQPLSKSLTKKY
jgi:hypothetical protein